MAYAMAPFDRDYVLTGFEEAEAVTKSDTTVHTPYSALYIGGDGDVAVRCAKKQNNVTFVSVFACTILRIQCDQILSTGTTATNIVGLR